MGFYVSSGGGISPEEQILPGVLVLLDQIVDGDILTLKSAFGLHYSFINFIISTLLHQRQMKF